MNLITHDQVKSKIIQIRNQNVIVDKDVANLYGVETKRINEAVKRNPEKFPQGYLVRLRKKEDEYMRSQIATSSKRRLDKFPIAFTEKGLYMLATILKSPKAVQTTIAIINTFAQFKNLAQTVHALSDAKTDKQKVKVFEESTSIIADILDNDLVVSQQETDIKIGAYPLSVINKN